MGEQLARCWRVRTEDSRERNISLAKHKPSTRAKWRSSMSARRSVLKTELDTADIVREAHFFANYPNRNFSLVMKIDSH